jgi:hypothetical protein
MTLPLDPGPIVGAQYTDLNTGCIYELDQDFDSPTFGQYIEVYCPVDPADVPPPLDLVPPPVVTIKSLAAPEPSQQEDGTVVGILAGTVGYVPVSPAGLADLATIIVQSTRYPRVDDATKPDWTLATEWRTVSEDATGTLDTSIVQPNVLAGEHYWWRATAIDASGNVQQTWSADAEVDAAADISGPPRVSRIVIAPGMGVIGLRWDPVLAADFDYTEVQIRMAARAFVPGNPAAVPPVADIPARPVGDWISIQTAATVVVLTNLQNTTALDPVTYEVRLRSVDTSGNTQKADGTSVRVADDAEAGWVPTGTGPDPYLTASPSALPGSALVWSDAIIGQVFAGKINADWISAGTLHVGGRPSSAAQIEVYNTDAPTPHLIGRWDANGILIRNPDASDNSRYQLKIDDASLIITDLLVPAQPLDVVTIQPLGIDAASVTFGSARGGHNLILNSSFEMGAFVAATNTPSQWDVAADWNAAGSRQGADTNVTTGASALTMTAI